MFKMIEVVGRSEKSYSDAVKSAVEEIVEAGEKAHFFEVVEHRGAVRNGSFKEFQVKLKVAVELDTETKITDKDKKLMCPTCLQPTGEDGHLCVPVGKKDKKCEWCGSLILDERHLCNDKIKQLAYICNTCGRTAVKAEHLCNPKKV